MNLLGFLKSLNVSFAFTKALCGLALWAAQLPLWTHSATLVFQARSLLAALQAHMPLSTTGLCSSQVLSSAWSTFPSASHK